MSVFRRAGALALLVAGVIHLQQYFSLYSHVPTIGPLFLLNFAGAAAIALGLLVPVERLWPSLSLAGAAMAGTALVFLLIAEHATLFGWTESGYYPTAIVLVLISEGLTVLLLSAFLLSTRPWAMWSRA
ncbi:MAG TPA: hypothetical protein VGF21_05490 [Thermoleophilaceae bacterium]|jgi:hypothetical protein